MRPPHAKAAAFTLIELLVVLAIVALLAALAAPEYTRLIDRARSASCLGNMRTIGAALTAHVGDNQGRFPYINNPPPYEIYDEDDDLPPETPPQTLFEALGPYGMPDQAARCPADASGPDYFGKVGTSYEWVPRIDGDQSVSPKVLSRRGRIFSRPLSRITVLRDFTAVHFGRANRLMGDGSVRWHQN